MNYNTAKIIFSLIVIFILIVGKACIAYGTVDEVIFTINKTERTGGDNGKYLIFTDNGVYENTDSLFWLKWNSSDIYNEIEKQKTYKAKVYGFRIGFLSWYKNIISIDEFTDDFEVNYEN